MTHKTQGIVIRTIDYSDTSIIAHIYTEKFGIQGYLINGAKRPRAKIHVNILQPLCLLNLEVYYKNTGQLQRIKEAKQTPVLSSIPLNIVKSTIAMFINEVLSKVLRNQNADEALFSFLFNSIVWLEEKTGKLANFHLLFLIKLSRHLGFSPSAPNRAKDYFDLSGGTFEDTLGPHPYYIAPPLTSLFLLLIHSNYEQGATINMTKTQRKELLIKILDFFALHTESFGEVKSLRVLEEIFADI